MRIIQELFDLVPFSMVAVCMYRIVNCTLIVGAILFSCYITSPTRGLPYVAFHIHYVCDRWHVPNDDNEKCV